MLRRLLFSCRTQQSNNCLSFSSVGDSCALGRMFQTSSPRVNTRIKDVDLIAEDVRLLMRRVTQPVVLVTTEHKGTSGKIQRGLTVSSFTTICLTPSPFVCFSTRQNSRTADLIASREYFVVTLLPCTLESVNLAEAFSKSDLAPHPNEQLRNPLELGRWRREEKWDLPILDGGLGALLCRVDKAYNIGDHKLWIAEVRDAIIQDISGKTALGYCKREYRKEGQAIWPNNNIKE